MSRGKKPLSTKRPSPNPEVLANLPDLNGIHPQSARWEKLLSLNPQLKNDELIKICQSNRSVDLLKIVTRYSENQSLLKLLQNNESLSNKNYIEARIQFFTDFLTRDPGFDQYDHWLMSDLGNVINSSKYDIEGLMDFLEFILKTAEGASVLSQAISQDELTPERIRRHMDRLLNNKSCEAIFRVGFLQYQRRYGKHHPAMHSVFHRLVSYRGMPDGIAHRMIIELINLQPLEIPDDIWPVLLDIDKNAHSTAPRTRNIPYLLNIIKCQKVDSKTLWRVAENERYPFKVRMAASNHANYPTRF